MAGMSQYILDCLRVDTIKFQYACKADPCIMEFNVAVDIALQKNGHISTLCYWACMALPSLYRR